MSSQEDGRHQRVIRENLNRVLLCLEEGMYRVVDPTQIDSQTVYNIFIQRERIKTDDNLTPENYLNAIGLMEKWYQERKLELPHPEWLNEVRSFWEVRLKDKE